MMWQVTFLSLAALGSATNTLFQEARTFEEQPLTVATEAAYRLWAWAPGEAALALTVDDASMQLSIGLELDPASDGIYTWHSIDTVSLASGDWQLQSDAGVAGVWLSSVEGLTPQEWLQDRRVLTAPEAVTDRRAQVVKHTDTVFTMPQYETLEAWESKAETLRRRMLIASGLYHAPADAPLNLQIFDKVEYEDYSIEKAHFEAYPGFLVTGNLYRPVGKRGPFPGIVSPHGHWAEGRLVNDERGSIAARGITMARMGMVVFTYDMLGYHDSKQFDHNHLNEVEKLWGLHPFALQLLSGIRAVDMMYALPDVDNDRIGVTGASGGGTQTFILMAVDPRVDVAAPVTMISSTMQGGCLCENAPILRLDNSNMEIGGMMAPRPLLLVAATGDWTRETPWVEYPSIRSIYRLYGAEDNVEQILIDAEHNYNKASREAVYRFFGKHLLPEEDWSDFTEPDYVMPADSELLLFPEGLPSEFPDDETLIKRWITDRALLLEQKLDRADKHAVWRDNQLGNAVLREAYREMLGLALIHPNELEPERLGYDVRADHVLERWLLRHHATGAAIPMLFYRSPEESAQDVVLLVHGEGKAALAGDDGGPGEYIQDCLDSGVAVLSIDPYLVGEQHSPFAETTPLRVGRFHDTFQPTDTARRVQDIVAAASFLELRRDIQDIRGVMGFGEAGIWALLAGVLDERIALIGADMNHFSHEDDDAWLERYYIPGIRALGGLKLLCTLSEPDRILLFNVPETDSYPNAEVLNAPRLD